MGNNADRFDIMSPRQFDGSGPAWINSLSAVFGTAHEKAAAELAVFWYVKRLARPSLRAAIQPLAA
jgi:hypothetical protein